MVIAHIGPVPVEELVAGCAVVFAVGVPTMRAIAKSRLSRRQRSRRQ
jgi:hypothetical protein